MIGAPHSQAELDRFAVAFNSGVMMRYLGLTISFPERERVVVALAAADDHHRGGMGSPALNGGMIAAMADYALGCTSVLAPLPLRRSATIELTVKFERPVLGPSASCEARVDRAAKRILFSSAKIVDSKGNVCSRASAIMSLGPEETLESWGERLRAPLADRA